MEPGAGSSSSSAAEALTIWWSPCAAILNDTERYEQFAFSIYRLKGLQSLCIRGSDGSVDFLDHLHHPLGRLQKVQVNGSCYVNRIPWWFRSLPALAYLRIDVKEVKNADLQLSLGAAFASPSLAVVQNHAHREACYQQRWLSSSSGVSAVFCEV
jgi:hypothetical protein